MQKKNIYGDNLRQRLEAAARDRLYRFVMRDNKVRGGLIHATRMINEMRANHDLGILETLILGQAYLAASLMTTHLKGQDRVGMKIECSGPVKGLSVEATATGEVRGFLSNPLIPIDKPLEDFNTSPFFGAGFLSVTKIMDDAKQPFTGQVMLQYGSIARDVAYYYVMSEQVPTALRLNIQFDADGEVVGAGGLMLQLLPGAEESLAEELETIVSEMPGMGQAFAEGTSPEDFLHQTFSGHGIHILENHRMEFFCPCTRDRILGFMGMLPMEDIRDMAENGPYPIETHCHYCNSFYSFEQETMQELYDAVKDRNSASGT